MIHKQKPNKCFITPLEILIGICSILKSPISGCFQVTRLFRVQEDIQDKQTKSLFLTEK